MTPVQILGPRCSFNSKMKRVWWVWDFRNAIWWLNMLGVLSKSKASYQVQCSCAVEPYSITTRVLIPRTVICSFYACVNFIQRCKFVGEQPDAISEPVAEVYPIPGVHWTNGDSIAPPEGQEMKQRKRKREEATCSLPYFRLPGPPLSRAIN